MKEIRIPSGKKVLILKLLASQEQMYGLEMVKASSDLKVGTAYTLLGRMEKEGFVSSEHVTTETGSPRRMYQLTRLGQKVLYSWMEVNELFEKPSRGVLSRKGS